MGKATKKTSKPRLAALITYVIALLCLLAGLLVPLAPLPLKETFKVDNMLIMQAFAALQIFGLKLPFAPDTFLYSFGAGTADAPVKLFGVIPTFNVGAVLVLLYVVVCVVALIGLIPVIAGLRKPLSIKAASFIEVLGAIFAGLLVLVQVGQFALGVGTWSSWALAPVIGFGGCVLMLVIQAFVYKRGSGVIKFILFLLSVVATFCALFAQVAYSQLNTIVGKLPGFINDYSLYNNGNAMFGVALISSLFVGNFSAMFAGAILEKVLTGIVLALSLLIIINAILDLMGLGKKTNKGMLIANVVRYVLELILVIVFVVFTFVVKDYKLGFFGYVVAVVALLQFIIDLIRLITYKPNRGKKKKKGAKPATTESGESAAVVAEEEKVDKKAAKRAAKEAKKAEKEAKKNAKQNAPAEEETAAATPIVQHNPDPSVYTVEPVYNGPVDDFIKKLTNAERIEFAHCFIEKNLVLPNVPDYIVGGNNTKFFSSVFIYYARIHERVSDGLINKLYEQGNMM